MDISTKQFAFLNNSQIYEDNRTTQEGIHSLKIHKMKGMIFKIYLSKDFDRTSWLYLRMLLTQLGFPQDFIMWVMFCISSVSYNILINGSTSNFFHAECGLRQGCPLSPLLFLLVMEGLSRLITDENFRGKIKDIKIEENVILSHLLFMDDVLIFLNGSLSDSTSFNIILSLFYKATGMVINHKKYSMTTLMCLQYEIDYANLRFPFRNLAFDDGLKYLGFRLKHNTYKIIDWSWLVAKIENRINIWNHRPSFSFLLSR